MLNHSMLMLLPAKLRPYAKAVIALLGSLVAAAAMVYADNTALAGILQMMTVLGVYAQKNGDNGSDDELLDLDVELG